MKKSETITETLRRCVGESETSQRQLAIAAGISPVVLNRFLRQGTGLSAAGIDNLAEVLGLQLVPTTTNAKTNSRRKGN